MPYSAGCTGSTVTFIISYVNSIAHSSVQQRFAGSCCVSAPGRHAFCLGAVHSAGWASMGRTPEGQAVSELVKGQRAGGAHSSRTSSGQAAACHVDLLSGSARIACRVPGSRRGFSRLWHMVPPAAAGAQTLCSPPGTAVAHLWRCCRPRLEPARGIPQHTTQLEPQDHARLQGSRSAHLGADRD